MSKTPPKNDQCILRLTETGRAVLIGTAFILLAVLVIPAFGILAALLALEGMALVIGYCWRPRIRFSSPVLDSVLAGETVTLTYTLENQARVSAYHLYVALEHLPGTIERIGNPVLISCVRAHETSKVTIRIRPHRRGHYEIGRLTCVSAFPFNLFSFGLHSSQPNELVVLPPVHPIQVQTSSLRADAWTRGVQVAGQAGASANYIGNRPYVLGDSPRNIDARAWARLSVPAIKEFHEDFILHAGIILDTHVSSPSPMDTEVKELEAGIVLAASMAHALHRDYMLDLLIAGPEMFELIEGTKTSRFTRLHEILADVQLGPEALPEEKICQWADQLSRLHEVVFILQGWHSPLAPLLRHIDQFECSRTVVMIGPEERSCPDDVDMTWPGTIHCLTPEMILKKQVLQL